MRFTVTWRDGAYYVSEPNVGTREVVDVADMEAAVAAERSACLEIAARYGGADANEIAEMIGARSFNTSE